MKIVEKGKGKKMKDTTKRNLILGVLVVALVAAGYINYSYNAQHSAANANISPSPSVETVGDASPSPDGSTQTIASAAFFSEFRNNRDKVRSQEVEYLDSVINNKNSDEESLKDAQMQEVEITQRMEKELNIEGLIKAKGFSDAVITLNEGSVNVVVDKDTLSKAEVAQVLDIVKRETGEKAENIKIMARG